LGPWKTLPPPVIRPGQTQAKATKIPDIRTNTPANRNHLPLFFFINLLLLCEHIVESAFSRDQMIAAYYPALTVKSEFSRGQMIAAYYPALNWAIS
jgi:hypothetical protein